MFSRFSRRRRCRVREDGHAEIDQLGSAVGNAPAEAVELGGGGVEADLESFDFAQPAVAAGFADPLTEVLDDLDEP
ncbi:hypothetical protein [Streptomyces sp. NBC_01268]|uniref:hypothetical protein n=1 Tax=Streptomyces sp. NBC_01268 TaxID=2903806 RepID=UPI002E36D21A|nr:hypothetical protein [Streptomyces sp. NBC_01268]